MKLRKYGLIILFAIGIILIKEQSFAEAPVSKEIAFEITQDYEACSFTITTQKQGNFEVELFQDGNSEKYTSVIADSRTCEISVEDVKAGKWHVVVKQQEVLYETETLTTEEHETDGEEHDNMPITEEKIQSADEVIGKIQVQAKAIDKTAFSIGNVSVARDIVGLETYFKDDSIVVEWTDSSCGNVNISVVDTYTNQILDKQTVSGRYYEFELPELVSEITVDIVPATSANITGANSSYTLPVVNSPDAIVSYEDNEYTNEETVPVKIRLNNAYALLFVVNGEEVKTTGIMSAGEYTYKIPIVEGSNEILTYVIDANHNMRSTAYTVIRDSIKPALTLEMEYDGIETYDDTIVIAGTIKDYDEFMINETEPVVAGDGSFQAEYILKDGENILNVCARDVAGNETLYIAVVIKLVKDTSTVLKYIYIALGVICVLIVWIAYKLYNNKRDKSSKSSPRIKTKNIAREKQRKMKEKSSIKDNRTFWLVIVCAVTVICTYLFFTQILIGGSISSPSMEPTLQVGDYVISNGLAYVTHEPQRGDVIIFTHDDVKDGETLIKRIIGVPGDSLVFADGYLYINGELVYEPYLPEDMETNSCKDFDEIPEGCYFVMGDNREDSLDSRFWDDPYVQMQEIKGKLLSAMPVSRLIDTVTNFR